MCSLMHADLTSKKYKLSFWANGHMDTTTELHLPCRNMGKLEYNNKDMYSSVRT